MDDWQPCVQLKKAYVEGNLHLSDPESVATFADENTVQTKYVVSYLQHIEVIAFKKRREERARKNREAKEKVSSDWEILCQNTEQLKKLLVPELNKYLQHHGLRREQKLGMGKKTN